MLASLRHVSFIALFALSSFQTKAQTQAEDDVSFALSRLGNISAEAGYIREMLKESSALSLNEAPAIPFNYGYTEQALTYIMQSIEEFTLLSSRETDGAWNLNTGEVQRYEYSQIRNVVISRSLSITGNEQERLSLITEQVQNLYELVANTKLLSDPLSNGLSIDQEYVLTIIDYIEYGLKAHISLINNMPNYMSTSNRDGISNEHPE
ncbi:hypothetical protein OAM69_03880 [bacterium]|nr:hypothetical protein [bacterium]